MASLGRTGVMSDAAVDERVPRDQVIWSFGPDLRAVVEVEPGAVVCFETNDCFTGQIRTEDDLVTEIDMARINSATGPVAVRGAEPGDALVAELIAVEPIEWGVATIIPGFGQLIEHVGSPVTRRFEVRDGWVHMNDRIRFPARPMVGVIGVATGGDTLSNGLAGRHGGNLDNHLHGPGARILLPVRQEGGLFAVGDMHASMGDGEVCFTGVEIAGEVTVRLDVVKARQSQWPVTELPGHWVLHGTADDFQDASKLACEEAARMLVDDWGMSMEDAFIFLSVACDVGVAQACKPAPGFGTIARVAVPKLPGMPRPFGA
jgi:amidase